LTARPSSPARASPGCSASAFTLALVAMRSPAGRCSAVIAPCRRSSLCSASRAPHSSSPPVGSHRVDGPPLPPLRAASRCPGDRRAQRSVLAVARPSALSNQRDPVPGRPSAPRPRAGLTRTHAESPCLPRPSFLLPVPGLQSRAGRRAGLARRQAAPACRSPLTLPSGQARAAPHPMARSAPACRRARTFDRTRPLLLLPRLAPARPQSLARSHRAHRGARLECPSIPAAFPAPRVAARAVAAPPHLPSGVHVRRRPGSCAARFHCRKAAPWSYCTHPAHGSCRTDSPGHRIT